MGKKAQKRGFLFYLHYFIEHLSFDAFNKGIRLQNPTLSQRKKEQFTVHIEASNPKIQS